MKDTKLEVWFSKNKIKGRPPCGHDQSPVVHMAEATYMACPICSKPYTKTLTLAEVQVIQNGE